MTPQDREEQRLLYENRPAAYLVAGLPTDCYGDPATLCQECLDEVREGDIPESWWEALGSQIDQSDDHSWERWFKERCTVTAI
ncbi:MAG TPA: hypothetical protein VIO57_01180 [Chloroflexota bacterium]|jgi:hypothetical protein